jgi:Fe-Mn family superoxide dismutase
MKVVDQETGEDTLPPLTYPFNALEPHIDAKTMEIHHDRHHAAYVANLNNDRQDQSAARHGKIPDVLGNLNALNDASNSPCATISAATPTTPCSGKSWARGGGKPEGDVLAAIDRDLGGMEKFQNDFNAAGGRQFGSGWVFVTVAKDGKLAIETRPNQDNPIMDGKRALMGNDVWEHASKRSRFITLVHAATKSFTNFSFESAHA